MKLTEKLLALDLREKGYSINEIATRLDVSKSSASLWVRNVQLTTDQVNILSAKPFTKASVEKRRATRLINEAQKREIIFLKAKKEIRALSYKELWLIGVMLYWAEGGKTQRMVRFSNGDPEMIKIMMHFFRIICKVPEAKFRGYIHIHPHLDFKKAEIYWSEISGIPLKQFFKTYRKQNKSSQNKKDSLPNGVMDIYVLNTELFLRISGWAQGVFEAHGLKHPDLLSKEKQ